jgi:transcriptional regulator with XRE-family HTH domain
MPVTVGRAIKIIREANNKSLGFLASEARISTPYLSLVEADKRTPSLDVIKRLSEALNVPADIFFLIGSGSNSSLNSSNDLTSRLISMLNQMEVFEKRIQDAVG